MGAGPPLPDPWNSHFGGLLFAPTATPPCTCSSDRGWCGVGPLGRKYKPLSFRCLANKSCGGTAAPRFRHVPTTTQWGVFVRIYGFVFWVMGSAAHQHEQHPHLRRLIKGVAGWLFGWLVEWFCDAHTGKCVRCMGWITLVDSRVWGPLVALGSCFCKTKEACVRPLQKSKRQSQNLMGLCKLPLKTCQSQTRQHIISWCHGGSPLLALPPSPLSLP